MTMKGFTFSYVCNWSDEIKGESRNYRAACAHSDQTIEIAWSDSQQNGQSIELTLEGFNQLANWVQEISKQLTTKDESP